MKALEQIIQKHGPIIWIDDVYIVTFDEKTDVKIFAYDLECNSDFLGIDFSTYDNLRDIGKEALNQYYKRSFKSISRRED